MDGNTHFFMVWTHRSAKSIFGPASHPIIRNGEVLCFDTEQSAQAECDRLNAASGGSHVHHSIGPAHSLPLPTGLVALANGFRRLAGEMSARRLATPPAA